MSPKSPRFICRRQRFGDFAPRRRRSGISFVFLRKKRTLPGPLFRGEGGIERALRAMLPGFAVRRQEDAAVRSTAFKARLSLTKALLKVKPVDDSTGFRERRRRDLNPRAAINDLHPFQGCPFGQLGYFSTMPDHKNGIQL